jgi:hypothetical protein
MSKPDSRQQIGQWIVPQRGNVRTVPAHDIPEDGLYDSLNMLARDARLRSRPGLRRFGAADLGPTGQPTGAFNYRDGAGKSLVIVGTTTGIYAWDQVAWRVLTAAAPAVGNAPAFSGTLTGDADHPSRFVSIQLGDRVYLLHTNGRDWPLQWDGVELGFRAIAGDPVGPEAEPGPPVPPTKFVDFCHIQDHILGIEPPYLVRWSNTRDLAHWPHLNFKSLSETPDPLVTVQPLGTLGAALYKTDSIWAVFAEGQTEASFFRFEFRGFYDGPASPASVVNVSGVHYYMTRSGRIGMFNGSDHRWVLDTVWPQIRDDIDQSKANRSFGIYDSLFHELLFFYPRLNEKDGLPRGLLYVSLPRQEAGPGVIGGFPGRLSERWGKAVTAGLAYRLNDLAPKLAVFGHDQATVLYAAGGQPEACDTGALPLDEARDANEPFSFFWRTGLQSTPGIDTFRIDAIEPFLERDTNHGLIQVQPVLSYALPIAGGELGPATAIDLERRYVRPVIGLDARGRFHGTRYSFDPTASTDGRVPRVRYYGTLIYGHKV